MNGFLYKKGKVISMLLAFLLVFMSIPFTTTAKAQAVDKTIVIKGYEDVGSGITNPLIYGDPMITLSGAFAEVVGENLRYKISVNNGKAEEYDSIKPTVSNVTFTFRDIPLKPGMNRIIFYERTGSITREVGNFYIEYNNTPLISKLTIDGVAIEEPTSSKTTLITVPNSNRLTLTLAGNAKNADRIEVKNNRKPNQVFSSYVPKSGDFSMSLPTALGENDLTITGFSSNKEIKLINRKVLVTALSGFEANQFYNVRIGKNLDQPGQSSANNDNEKRYLTLIPDRDPVATYEEGKDNDIRLRASVLVFADADREIKSFVVRNKKDNNRVIGGAINEVNEDQAEGKVYEVDNSYWVKGTTDDRFKLYTINVNLGKATLHNQEYELALEYTYTLKSDPTRTPNPDNITNTYKFIFADANEPRFVDVNYEDSGQSLSKYKANPVATSPLKLLIKTKNMDKPFVIKLKSDKKNYETLEEGKDYEIDRSGDLYKLIMRKLPVGTNTLRIENPAKNLFEEYELDVQIAPYVQLTSGNTVFYDGFQAKSKILPTIDGKIYNYPLSLENIDPNGSKKKAKNVTVKLNNKEIKQNNDFYFTGIDSFKLVGNAVFEKDDQPVSLNSGDNTLEISLTDFGIKMTYQIFYTMSTMPKISDVKLMVEQDKKQTELSLKSTETNYKTATSFLSSFSFQVEHADDRVWIEKNGKVLAVFDYKNNGWELDTTHPEYIEARDNATTSHSATFWEGNSASNFKYKSSSSPTKPVFEAVMTSRQNGNLLEILTDENQVGKLELFPLTLKKEVETMYTIVASDKQGSVIRYNVPIQNTSKAWGEVIYPIKTVKDPYIIVNTNSTPIRIFAENADKVLFGKEEAITFNTSNPDFRYNDELSRSIPATYFVFESVVTLKPGLNKIKYTVVKGESKYNDEVQIYNASSSVGGAEYRDILGKKVKFTAFDKQVELSFPKGTVLLAPSSNQIGKEARDPSSEIFVDVPLYFGIADRTDGHVSIEGKKLEPRLLVDQSFTYAGSMYYIDAGNIGRSGNGKPAQLGGRDPYFSGDGIVNGEKVFMETFHDRYAYNLIPSNPGTLTLSYNSSIVNSANNTLTVYYNNGEEWQNLGGMVNTGKKTITVPFNGFGFYVVMKTKDSFEDVITHPFARNDMTTLFSKGIMDAYSGNSFGAHREMSRGELATILVKAVDLPINAGPYVDEEQRYPEKPTFLDVVPTRDSWDYQYKYIETAARAGIVSGKQPGYFRPDDPVTRQEAAIMISRAMNLKLAPLDKAQNDVNKLYTDGSSVGYYAAPSVGAISKAKIMSGIPNDPNAKKTTYKFLPNANLTRAEMATVAVRLMTQLKKLSK